MVGGGLRGLRLFRLENGHITYYEDEESMRRAEAELDSMADVVRVCDACFRIFISEQALRKHAEDFHSEPKSTEPIQYLEKEDHELEPPELAMQYGNLEQEMDDDSDMPTLDVEGYLHQDDDEMELKVYEEDMMVEVEMLHNKGLGSDSGLTDSFESNVGDEFWGSPMPMSASEDEGCPENTDDDYIEKLKMVKEIYETHGQVTLDELVKYKGINHKWLWCKQCDSYLPNLEVLRLHVELKHKGIDPNRINKHNYATYDVV